MQTNIDFEMIFDALEVWLYRYAGDDVELLMRGHPVVNEKKGCYIFKLFDFRQFLIGHEVMSPAALREVELGKYLRERGLIAAYMEGVGNVYRHQPKATSSHLKLISQ